MGLSQQNLLRSFEQNKKTKTAQNSNYLHSRDLKSLRVYGRIISFEPVRIEDDYRIRSNGEVESLINGEDIVRFGLTMRE